MFSQVQIYDDTGTVIVMILQNRQYIHVGLIAGEMFSKATNNRTFFREKTLRNATEKASPKILL